MSAENQNGMALFAVLDAHSAVGGLADISRLYELIKANWESSKGYMPMGEFSGNAEPGCILLFVMFNQPEIARRLISPASRTQLTAIVAEANAKLMELKYQNKMNNAVFNELQSYFGE